MGKMRVAFEIGDQVEVTERDITGKVSQSLSWSGTVMSFPAVGFVVIRDHATGEYIERAISTIKPQAVQP